MKSISARLLSFSICSCWLIASPTLTSAQSWIVDIGSSTIDLEADLEAYDKSDYTNGVGPVMDSAIISTYIPGFTTLPGNVFSYGNDLDFLDAEAVDDDLSANPYTSVQAEPVDFVTIDGDLTNTLEIRWHAATLLQSIKLDGFNAEANVTTKASIVAELSGLTPGKPYRVLYDWEYVADALTKHEGAMEDPENAGTDLNFDFGGNLASPFNVAVDSDDPSLPVFDIDSGNGIFTLIGPAAGQTIPLTVDVFARSFGILSDPPRPPTDLSDLGGSSARGSITFVVQAIPVPEPASATLLVLACGFIGLRICRRRSRT